MATQLLEPVLQQKISHPAVFGKSPNNTRLTTHHAPLIPFATNTKATMRKWRSWAIIVSLMVTGLASALEGTFLTSALPTITEALGGGGGINLMIETVVTDLVPLRERGKYMSIVYLGATVGATIGPFLGDAITDRSTWRWCFYLNVPIGGIAFACLFVFLNVNYQREAGWKKQFTRIDVVGNLIFVGAIVTCLIALTWGGTTAFEWTPKLCKEQSFSRKIVSNRTSAAALGLIFIHAMVTYWTYYFSPIYLQTVKSQSPINSGLDTLPMFEGGLLCALIGGVLLSKLGRYKPLHFAASIPMIIAFGFGLMGGILLSAVQAPRDETYVATSAGLWSSARYFGCIWGVAITSAIFNSECSRFARGLGDTDIAEVLTGGRAYEYATAAFVEGIEDVTTRAEVVEVFSGALRVVWLIGTAFAGIGFLLVFVEKEIGL
ncbi:hypothetical protein MBLNU13_g07371t1 [Cladosporium sp. NU13]